VTFRPLTTLARRASFAVLPRDHFGGLPIPVALDVRLDPDHAPTAALAGGSRHADGTYRWVDVPDGSYVVTVSDPGGRWRFDAPAATVVVPLADPADPVEVDGRPTPSADAPLGLTVLRARLRDAADAPLAGLALSAGPPGGPFLRTATSEDDGELLFPVVEPHAVQADGTVSLELEVEAGARPVVSVSIGGAPATAGPVVSLTPGRTSRLLVEVGP
jgi:hypothetical protein